MAKSFYQKRLEKQAAKQKEELENVEMLLAKLDSKTEEKPAAVQIYTEQDMVEAVKAKPGHTAYNVFYDNKRKQFMLVTLNYDLNTQEAKILKTEPFSDNIVVASRKIAEIMSMKLFKREEEV